MEHHINLVIESNDISILSREVIVYFEDIS